MRTALLGIIWVRSAGREANRQGHKSGAHNRTKVGLRYHSNGWRLKVGLRMIMQYDKPCIPTRLMINELLYDRLATND